MYYENVDEVQEDLVNILSMFIDDNFRLLDEAYKRQENYLDDNPYDIIGFKRLYDEIQLRVKFRDKAHEILKILRSVK